MSSHGEHYEKLVPLKIDNQPRYIEPIIAGDLSETMLYQALHELRQLAHARGYTLRPLEFSDCLLVYSLIYQKTVDNLKLDKRFSGMTMQGVPAIAMRSMYAWALCFGMDVFISAPPS
jgi:hypothetical protein